MAHRTSVLASVVLALLLATTDASSFVVVATGDSLTNSYWYTDPMRSNPHEWDLHRVASGGMRAPAYVGWIEHKGDVHDYEADVLAIAPDVAVFMLGTNDAYSSDPNAWGDFQVIMSDVLTDFESAGIAAVVGIPPPVTSTAANGQLAESRLSAMYRPWLRAQAELRGLPVVDFDALFRAQPDFETLFFDGVHPTEEGAELMANAVIDEVAALENPDPATVPAFTLPWTLATGGVLLGMGLARTLRRHGEVLKRRRS